MTTLEVKKRDKKENLAKLRALGQVPAVFYGPKQESTPISIPKEKFDKAWKEAGESTVITLTGEFGEHDALIHEIDKDPITDVVRHADFYVIEKGKKVRVHVPVEFEGVSLAVKDLGAVLVKVLHEVEIEALPKALPHALIADITKLQTLEDHVLALDLKLPEGVTLITKPEEIIALATPPKEEKEEESAPIDLSAIEVEKKGKEPKEGEGDAGATEGGGDKEKSK